MKLLFILCCVVLFNSICGECPSKEALYPCTCVSNYNGTGNDRIICGGKEKYNMSKVFKSVSGELRDDEKHFYEFHFNNTAIDVWEEDIFNDITFERIYTDSNTNLSKINTNALTETSFTLRRFLSYSPKLTNDALNHNIFDVLTKCVKIEEIYIDSNITSIPSRAFSPPLESHPVQNKLKSIFVGWEVQTIGDYAFYELPNIEKITVFGNLTLISSNAFALRNPSNETLLIHLWNQFSNFSLSEGVFSNVKRPLNIYLGSKFTFLDENVFSPFFNANKKNTIDVELNPLNCHDCRNAWILKDKNNLMDRISHATCSDNKKLFDVSFNCL